MNQALATEPPTSLDILWTFGNWRTLWIYKWTFSMDLFPAFLPVSYFTGDPPFLNRCSELMVKRYHPASGIWSSTPTICIIFYLSIDPNKGIGEPRIWIWTFTCFQLKGNEKKPKRGTPWSYLDTTRS